MGLLCADPRMCRRRFTRSVERALKQLPELLDPASAPIDVLPVCGALHRVETEDGHSFMRTSSSPAEMASLKAGSYRHISRTPAVQVVWLVLLFVALDASKCLAVSWAATHGHMCAPLVICAKNALSIGCGMVFAGSLDGAKGLRRCLDMKRALRVLPIAGAFCAAQIFALKASRVFDPGSLKIIAQVNLPATAFLSWMCLGRRYTVKQWLAIGLLLVSAMAFLQVRMLFYQEEKPPPPPIRLLRDALWRSTERATPLVRPEKVVGMMWFLSGIALSCIASVYAELFLKNRYDIPFYIQKTNLMFGELLAACLMVHFSGRNETRDICSWEQMSDLSQFPVILIWFVHGWIAGLLVKRCSSLVKNVSHILSASVTYLFHTLLFAGRDLGALDWPVMLSALLVLIAVLVFATVPTRQEDKRSNSNRSGSRSRRHGGAESTGALVRAKSEEHLARKIDQQRRPRGASDKTALQPARQLPSPVETVSVGFLVLAFILLDATKPLLVTWAHEQKAPAERFIHGTFILVQTTLSYGVGLGIAVTNICLETLTVGVHPLWRSRLRRCMDLSAVLRQLPCACCFSLSKLLMLMALGRLDAGTVRVFGQASLPLVGLWNAVFLAKRYTLQQWCSLVAISVALVTFYYVKAEVYEKVGARERQATGRGIEVWGVLLTLSSICFNCLGSLFVEKFLKGDRGRLHEQKAQLLLGEVMVNGAILLLMPFCFSDPKQAAIHSVWHRGFFAGWDLRVLTCALVWIPAGWSATMLVKRCSNLLKTIAQGTSGVLTYVFSVVPLSCGPRPWAFLVMMLGPPLDPEPLSSPVVLLAVGVMLSALTFGSDRTLPAPEEAKEHWKVDPAYKLLPPLAPGVHQELRLKDCPGQELKLKDPA